MSGSTEQSAYKLLPVTAHKAPPASDRPQFNLLIEKKIEQSRQSRHLVKHWRWETFTFLLGTAALVTIIALVLQFRNKPFEDWRLRGVQTTSIIAALAQVAQSAFLVPILYHLHGLHGLHRRHSFMTTNVPIKSPAAAVFGELGG